MTHIQIKSVSLMKIRCCFIGSLKNPKPFMKNFYHISSRPFRSSSRLLLQQRNHYWISGILGKQTEITLKYMDEVPNEVKMIYRNDSMDFYLKYYYFIVCVVTGMLVVITVLKSEQEVHNLPLDDEINKLQDKVKPELLAMNMGYILCLMAFLGCMKRIAVRAYKVPFSDKYIFIFHGLIPFTRRKLSFRRGQCVRVDTSNLLSYLRIQDVYRVMDKQTVFLYEDHFKKPADLHVMLGEQEEYEDK